jgi:hypothetical protein
MLRLDTTIVNLHQFFGPYLSLIYLAALCKAVCSLIYNERSDSTCLWVSRAYPTAYCTSRFVSSFLQFQPVPSTESHHYSPEGGHVQLVCLPESLSTFSPTFLSCCHRPPPWSSGSSSRPVRAPPLDELLAIDPFFSACLFDPIATFHVESGHGLPQFLVHYEWFMGLRLNKLTHARHPQGHRTLS